MPGKKHRQDEGGVPGFVSTFQWLRKKWGWLVAVGFVLWQGWIYREHIAALPGISAAWNWISREPIPHADEKRFSILVANLVDDQNQENKALVLDELNKLEGIQVLSLDREIKLEDEEQRVAEEKGHKKAKEYLSDAHAHVLLWGKILKHQGKTIPKLYWTTTPTTRGERYAISDFRLPEIFWTDLSSVLSLLVAQQNQEFLAREGNFVADKLKPFIERVRPLVSSLRSESERASVLFVLAVSLRTYGEQAGSNQALHESASFYKEVLKEYTRERVPLQWAATQSNLGAALLTLGERENGTQRLEEAVTTFRDALKERTRDRVPLQWATTQNNLGNALLRLGERENGTQRLEEAVTAYRDALKENTCERVPLDWAMTQNNLGIALQTLGERENGTQRLEEAVTTFRDALKEYTRESVPLQWAATQNNLGVVLQTLGERENGTRRLEEAATTFRDALKERTRARVPLDWATTQNNLGTALQTLGERENGTQRLEEAVTAYRDALKERTRDRVPLDWAMTQDNLGNVLSTLGERQKSKDQFCQALACYGQALEEYERSSDYYAEMAKRNLGRVEATIVKLFGQKALEECRKSVSKK